MLKEAAEAGFYQLPGLADKYPRIEILSIAELLMDKKIEYPRLLDVRFKKAPKARKEAAEQIPLGAEMDDEGPFRSRSRAGVSAPHTFCRASLGRTAEGGCPHVVCPSYLRIASAYIRWKACTPFSCFTL